MTKATCPTIEKKLRFIGDSACTFATFFNAYKECSPDVQQIVDDMVSIVGDDDATKEEKEYALDVLIESLSPAWQQTL